jgi:hypothetical protein
MMKSGGSMKKIVVSQPFFFPWVGLFEQIRLADVYVHYDDVQFAKRSFVNRTRIKTDQGLKWLTVPLSNYSQGLKINELQENKEINWRRQHLMVLSHTYARAPYKKDMLDLVEKVFFGPYSTVCELSVASINEVCSYYNIANPAEFLFSSQLNIGGRSTQRLLDIVQKLDGDVYITGHGARNYFDHDLFERNNIRVEYMDYQRTPYPQLYGDFNPYVSVLDLIANAGKDGVKWIHSGTTYWKDFIHN